MPPFVPDKPHSRVLQRLGRATGIALALAGMSVTALRAVVAPEPVGGQAIDDLSRYWTLPAEQKSLVHALHLEGRVSYVDARWRHLWLERDGVGSYLPLSTSPPLLRQGQRVRIDGTIVPIKGLDGGSVTVTVLQEYEPIEPLRPENITDPTIYTNRVVAVQGYVDRQFLLDDDHLRLSLVVDDEPVTAWVKPRNPRDLPDWQGHFIRMTGLYQARFDPTGTQLSIELWTGRQEDVGVTGTMADSRRFELPATPINEIFKAPRGSSVRICGRVQASEPGNSLVVRDRTGEVIVQSVQQQRMPFGAEVEVVGTVALSGARWGLRSAFYRLVSPPSSSPPPAGPVVIDNAEAIRQLSLEEAAKGLPVSFTAVVTWSRPGTEFFFVEDISGGVRVRYPTGRMEPPPRNKYLRIAGVTYNSGFAPAVELRSFEDLGAMETPRVKEIGFEQAITGQEDGQLVEMRGFFQRTESEGNTRRIHLTTPGGEFVGLLESTVNFAPTPGSLVRIRGVCEAIADENGRITGILFRLGSLAAATIEADAPADFFDLPMRAVRNLRQLNTAGEMLRVRVAGIVLHAVPGKYVYLQDGDAGVLLLTRETGALSPGDQIEAVGILGWEGVRTELRETVCRRLRAGPAPVAVPLTEPARLSAALDSRLVRVRGTLLEAVALPERTRLTLQADGVLFEAVLDQADGIDERALRHGAVLELAGIYRLGFDDLRRSRNFQLQLRSPQDVAVLETARVWTVSRALMAAGLLSACTLLGLVWVVALRRRVNRQTAQIREQLERQARLEVEVQHAARLESLGVLGGGIAHDFNNVLTVIMGNLGVALADTKLAPTTYQHLQEIGRAAGRARHLTRQLLTFAKGGDPVLASVALARVVSEAVNLTLQGSTVRIEFSAENGLWNAKADKDQMAQVVQNLTQNAIQAMPDGGTLRVALANETIPAGAASPLAPGRYVRIALTDAGEGIPANVLPKIFDPYFSTRKTGSGLGLATVYSIVNKHQGRVAVESQLGRGTTVTFWLPAADAGTPAPAAGSATPFVPVREAPARPVRILFMDDEASIRMIGAVVLQRSGFDAVPVADGEAAVAEFRAAQAAQKPFDLLILDLTIPGGMGGRETIAEIRKLDATVPAIVSSGYSGDPVLANFARYGFQGMVPKPYEVTQLLTVIDQLLGRSR